MMINQMQQIYKKKASVNQSTTKYKMTKMAMTSCVFPARAYHICLHSKEGGDFPNLCNIDKSTYIIKSILLKKHPTGTTWLNSKVKVVFIKLPVSYTHLTLPTKA